jgi:Icc-related predicted phosphoesterase
MVLLCFSDIHGRGAGLKEIADASPEADAIVISGDVTQLGGYAEAERIIAPLLLTGKPVLAVRGNMDREGVERYLDEKGLNLHGAGRIVGDTGFHGLGGSSPTPVTTPFELSAEQQRTLLEEGHKVVSLAPTRILISHDPPQGTALDRIVTGRHVGSAVVRAFIEKTEPALCISGHIHESPGEDRIGATVCVNLGPYGSGRYAIIAIERTITILWRNT